MWDAWAAYDPVAVGYLHNESGVAPGGDINSARHEAISYAAYRVLTFRYQNSVNADATAMALDEQMASLEYDVNATTMIGDSPAAVGNRVAAAVLAFAASDASNELDDYSDPTYFTRNDPLPLEEPQFTRFSVSDVNRWQPLAFGDIAFTQNGIEAELVQTFLGSHWRDVRPFALHRDHVGDAYHDPGKPPRLDGSGGPVDLLFKANINEVLRFSSYLDPADGVVINISPRVWGNHPLGSNDGSGYGANPVTRKPYIDNMVKRGDYGRVLAEFWADGPDSETPPGHWNVIGNDITDHPSTQFRIGGEGPLVDELEWDVKRYFAMNASQHDAATAAWTIKRLYDYSRPITHCRYMASFGQSSDPGAPGSAEAASYFPTGLFLEPGLVEIVTSESSAAGGRHEHLSGYVGEIAVYAWGGEPADPTTEFSGAQWIRGKEWLPYQRDTFVTPAFAGYVSGHSCFSRAAAEVLTRFTNSPYFPGGIAEHVVPAGALAFELGPSEDVKLQWASYYDAADEAGISRIYGGIHVAPDDGPGRIIGSRCGIDAYELAKKYWDGSILTEPVPTVLAGDSGSQRVDWEQRRGLFYKLQHSIDLASWTDITAFVRATEDAGNYSVEAPSTPRGFYRVLKDELGAPIAQ